MSLSDCEKCRDTPCICGWEYRWWTKGLRLELIYAIIGSKKGDDKLFDLILDAKVPNVHPMKHEKVE